MTTASADLGPTALPVPPEVRALADELAPGRWPTADVAAVRESAARCRDLAARAAALAADVDGAHRDHATGSGDFHEGISRGHHELTGSSSTGLGRLTGRLEAAASALEDYADAAVSAHNEMAVIASVADRERLRSDLLSTLGDDSARVVAAGAGRMALTAAGDDYTDQANDAGQRHHDGDQPPPAATSGMMPFSALGGLAAGAGALAGRHAGAGMIDESSLAEIDSDWLQRRAAQLQAGLPSSVAGSVRMAIGVGTATDGSRAVVVGTSDPYPYEREGTELGPGETLVGNGRAAELAIVDHMIRTGVDPHAIAAATPMSSETMGALMGTGAELFAPDDGAEPGVHWLPDDGGDQS
ncbi:hypothetical protein [Gordonia insulae]|uniref:Uncharacterized protein n=1 Tax=Gordonia insulae TaxID=2420509 RepID=A0A3G8JGA0_9ACTN|nr:hypothetical protein [Gordonia insulae]AZG44024.1 hypothetical protein D7316_00604 [Gordonia insulae]